MKMLLRGALALACALVASSCAYAQHATDSKAPAGWAPEQVCLTWSGGTIGSGSLVPCGTGGGGGGGAVTIGDGADVTNGATTDAAYTGSGAATRQAVLKGIFANGKALNDKLDDNSPSPVVGVTMIAGCAASPCFTTTSATTAWTAGQLIADNTTAASVTKMTFNICRVTGGTGMIRRARLKIASDTGFAGQSVILYLYRDSPTLTNGDRGAWLTTESNYLGQIPITLKQHFSDYEKGTGVPVDSNGNQTEINYDCNGTTGPTGLLVASGTITPQAGSKAVTVVLEALVN